MGYRIGRLYCLAHTHSSCKPAARHTPNTAGFHSHCSLNDNRAVWRINDLCSIGKAHCNSTLISSPDLHLDHCGCSKMLVLISLSMSRKICFLYSCCSSFSFHIQSWCPHAPRTAIDFPCKNATQTAASLGFAHSRRSPKEAWPPLSPMTVFGLSNCMVLPSWSLMSVDGRCVWLDLYLSAISSVVRLIFKPMTGLKSWNLVVWISSR